MFQCLIDRKSSDFWNIHVIEGEGSYRCVKCWEQIKQFVFSLTSYLTYVWAYSVALIFYRYSSVSTLVRQVFVFPCYFEVENLFIKQAHWLDR